MPSPRHWIDWVAPDLDSPPPGSVGSDHDGSHFLMGCGHWTPAREGQVPAIVPEPTSASRQDPGTCDVCGTAIPAGIICGGCLVDPTRDGRHKAEVVRDVARADARAEREAAEKPVLNYAQKKHGRGD
jgi:hypothetical protein